MDTEEMSRRGIEDAGRGDPDPFYYQHYYYYRRSYDQARRRNMPLLRRFRTGLLISGLIGALAVTVFLFSREPLQPQSTTASAAEVLPVPTATPKPLFPTPTLPPPTEFVEQVVTLQTNAFAVVSNTAGKTLRGRAEPSLKAKVQTTFSEGERVRLVEGPVEADGLRWWRVEGEKGSGWSAEQSAEGIAWLLPSP